METKINEKNFYYNDLVYKISEDILENLSLSIKYDQTQYHWPYKLKIDEEEEYLNFTYSVARIPVEHFTKNDIVGSSGPDECCMPHVNIQMLLQERKWMRKHQYEYAEIANVVAHELHHLAQDFELVDYSFDQESIIDYFLNPLEVEAFHIGFRAESDITGRSIEYCIRTYLNNFVENDLITKKECESILVKWLNPEIKLLKGVK